MADQTTPAHAAPEKPTGFARYMPIFAWLPHYDKAWLLPDFVAGATIWALLVPEVMGYAGVAGVPVQYGLYSSPLAGLAYMVFGGSRRLFFGPDASVAVISATTVGAVVAASSKDQNEYIAVTAILALLVGVIYIAAGLLKFGWIAKFFAQPVLAGFIVGLGIFIAVSQLPKLVGLEKGSGDTVKQFVEVVGHIGSWQTTTVAVGFIALAVLLLLGRFLPRVPAALLVVVVAIILSSALNLESHGVSLVGHVPTGFHFAPWSGVSASDIVKILPGAFAIVLVGFAQSVAIAKSFAAKSNEKVDPNQELIGYGVGNLGAGALQGFVVTGSLSKSDAAKVAGGKSPLTLGVSSLLVIITIFALAGLFKELPEAVLGAIIINAVAGSMNPRKLVSLWRAHMREFWLALGALLGVIVINILPGVLIGVLLSFMLLIRRLDHPRTVLMGRSPDGQYFASIDTGEKGKVSPVPDMLIYGFRAPLLFSNCEYFGTDLKTRVESAEPRPHTVIVDFDGISETDSTGAGELAQVQRELGEMKIPLLLARVNEGVRDFLERDGALTVIGKDKLYPTIGEAVDAAPSQPTAAH